MSGAAPGGIHATGTSTKTFSRTPNSLLPSAPPIPAPPPEFDIVDGANDKTSDRSGDGRDAWQQKQAEIRELQEANRTLLRRVATSSSGTPTRPPIAVPSASSPNLGTRPPGLFTDSNRSLGQGLPLPVDAHEVASVASSTGLLSVASAARRSKIDLNAVGTGSGTVPAENASLAAYLPVVTPSDDALLLPAGSDAFFNGANSAAMNGPPKNQGIATPQRQDLQAENRRMAGELAALRADALELRQQAAERERELRSHKAAAQRGREAIEKLEEAERKNSTLQDELTKLQKAKELIEQFQASEGGVAHKTVRSYIENDIVSMRAERQNAEALLRAETAKHKELAERLKEERDSLEADLQRMRIEATRLREEHQVALRTCRDVDNLRERHDMEMHHQSVLAKEAIVQMERRAENTAEVYTMELRASEGKLAATTAAGIVAQQESEVQRVTFERRIAEISSLENCVKTRESLAAEECQKLREILEQKEAAAGEERRKLKKDALKQKAEMQVRASELQEEAEESAAKAKEAERNMHARLAAARQDKQRLEGKIKNQKQSLQAEMAVQAERAASTFEAEELVEQFNEVVAEVQTLRSEFKIAETECTSLRHKHSQAVRQLRYESETHHHETQVMNDQAKHELQSELLEERKRCHTEVWERLTAIEERHSSHMRQLQKAHAGEISVVTEHSHVVHAEMTDKLKSEAHLSAELKEETIALQESREQLVDELASVQLDMQGVVQQHEALVNTLRQERTVADTQFHELLRQAEEKQRRLGRLQNESSWKDVVEVPPSPDQAISISTVTTTGSSRPLLPLPLTPTSASSIRSVHGGGGGGLDELVANDGYSHGVDGVDTVMRALTRERESRRVHRIGDELKQLLACATWEVDKWEQRHRSTLLEENCTTDDSTQVLPSQWKENSHHLLMELLGLYDQAVQGLVDEEIRLAAGRDREMVLRAHLARLDSRVKALREEAGEREKMTSESRLAEWGEFDARHSAALEEQRDAFFEKLKEAEDCSARLVAAQPEVLLEAKQAAAEHANAQVHAEWLYCQERLAKLESHSAKGLQWIHCEVADERESFRGELNELRRTLRRELASTREEHGGLARRELHHETNMERANQERRELAEEVVAAQRRLAEQEKVFQSEIKAANDRHREEQDLLAREIVAFQEEKLNLEARLSALENGSLETAEELAEARVRLEEPSKSNTEIQHLRERLHLIEKAEAQAEQASIANTEQHQILLGELQANERTLKEQLKVAREEKIKEKGRSDKLVRQLRGRVQELEEAETAAIRQRDLESSALKRSTEAHAKQLGEARREGRKRSNELQQQTLLKTDASQELQDLRREFLVAQEHHQDANDYWQRLNVHRFQAEEEAHALLIQESERQATLLEELTASQSAQEFCVQSHRSQAMQMQTEHEAATSFLRQENLRMESELQSLMVEASEAFKRECVQLGPALGDEAFKRECVQLGPALGDEANGGSPTFGGESSSSPPALPARKDTEAARKLALSQKELVKLREENQELRLEQKLLQERLASLEGARNVLEAACQTTAGVPKPIAVAGGGQSQVDLRAKLKEMQKAKERKEREVMELKHELVTRCQPLKEEIDQLKNALWELQQQREVEEDGDKRRTATFERRIRILEGKLRDRLDHCRALSEEKEAVEEQLSGAVRQLEALLTEEHKDVDLQRDLAGLSKQFELLHGKHRAQLARAAEQNKLLQGERDSRRQLEQQLQEAKTHMGEELSEVSARHDEQIVAMQETAQSLRRRAASKDRQLQEALSEQAALAIEASTLRTATYHQSLSVQELQEEIKRLQAEVEYYSTLVSDAKKAREPRPSERQREAEVEVLRRAKDAAEQALHRERLRLQKFKTEAQAQKAEQQQLNVELLTHSSELEEAKEAASESADARTVRVRTVYDRDFDAWSAPRGTSRGGNGNDTSGAWNCMELATALEDIQSTLCTRERELQECKAAPVASCGGSRPSSQAAVAATASAAAEVMVVETPEGANGVETRSPAVAAVPPDSVAAVAAAAVDRANLEEIERDFHEHARSIGFRGDISSLWEEARMIRDAEAMAAQQAPLSPPPPPRGPPIAADIQLKVPGPAAAASLGDPKSYPQSPPGSPKAGFATAVTSAAAVGNCGGSYPKSPRRSEGWLSAIEEAPVGDAAGENGGGAGRGRAAAQQQQIGLPDAAREAFRRAETLCEQQQYAEAVPLFRRVLQMLEVPGGGAGVGEASVPPAVTAEVWAHLGVAMQSLDRVPEAIDSYKRAVFFDSSLHVCFANLATLHAYLHERELALGYIDNALGLDSTNSTYHKIRRYLEAEAPAAAVNESEMAPPSSAVASDGDAESTDTAGTRAAA